MRMASEHAAHVGNLFDQVGRHLRAIGFILGKLLHAVGRLAALENGRDVRRIVLLGQLAQHVVENVNRLGGKPGAGAHGRRAAAGAGMIGAKNESERVDQE